MTQDAYWDDLGVAWTAIKPDPQTMAPAMKQRLRRQTAMAAAILFAGFPLSLAGVMLGAWTIWFGASTQTWNFIPRGIGIVVISLLAGFASGVFRGVLRDEAQSLRAMLELALARAQKWHQAVRLAFFSCILAAISGGTGYGIAAYFRKPQPQWPIEPLIINVLLGLVFFLLQKQARDQVARYRHLKNLSLEEP